MDEKTNKLINDALHNNLTNIEKYDIDDCFGEEFPDYFEADSIDEFVDYVKNKKIKAKFRALLAFDSSIAVDDFDDEVPF